MEDKLKPCPFCGAEPIIKQKGNNSTPKRSAIVHCKGCNTKMEVGALKNSLEWCFAVVTHAWNTRAV